MTTDPLLLLKERICELYDAEELLDMLGITAMDLLDTFELKLVQNKDLMATEVDE